MWEGTGNYMKKWNILLENKVYKNIYMEKGLKVLVLKLKIFIRLCCGPHQQKVSVFKIFIGCYRQNIASLKYTM